jgi:hypothetical protein
MFLKPTGLPGQEGLKWYCSGPCKSKDGPASTEDYGLRHALEKNSRLESERLHQEELKLVREETDLSMDYSYN